MKKSEDPIYLSHYRLDILEGDALVVAPDDELKQIVTKHLKHHAHVSPVDAADLEVVQELNTPFAEGILLITFTNLTRELEGKLRRYII